MRPTFSFFGVLLIACAADRDTRNGTTIESPAAPQGVVVKAHHTSGTTATPGDSGFSDAAPRAPEDGANDAVSRSPPNIVVVMMDDLDSRSFDLLMRSGKLPRIQSGIVEVGTSFTEAFVTTSLCCPSRVSFYTGAYAHCHGVLHNQTPYDAWTAWEARHDTLPMALQAAGYRTGHFGKFLNSYEVTSPIPRGWNVWHGMPNESAYEMFGYEIVVTEDGSTPVVETPLAHQVDELAARATAFIRTAREPFFVTYEPAAPHTEEDQGGSYRTREDLIQMRIRPPSRYLCSLRARDATGGCLLGQPASGYELPGLDLPSWNEADISDKPAWMRNGPNGTEGEWPLMTLGSHGTWTYLNRQHLDRLEVMRAMDDAVGAIIDGLATRNVLDRTLILFVSDNGYALGEHRRGGMKMDAYEESIRVPLVIREPHAGKERSVALTALNIDWGPTLADYASTKLQDADGRSLRALASGEIPETWRKRFLVEHWFAVQKRPGRIPIFDLPDFRAIRTVTGHRYPEQLYVEYTASTSPPPYRDGSVIDREQYDLAADPYEISSVHASPAYTASRATLARELSDLATCSGDTCRALEDLADDAQAAPNDHDK